MIPGFIGELRAKNQKEPQGTDLLASSGSF